MVYWTNSPHRAYSAAATMQPQTPQTQQHPGRRRASPSGHSHWTAVTCSTVATPSVRRRTTRAAAVARSQTATPPRTIAPRTMRTRRRTWAPGRRASLRNYCTRMGSFSAANDRPDSFSILVNSAVILSI